MGWGQKQDYVLMRQVWRLVIKRRGWQQSLGETAQIWLVYIVFAISWHLVALMPIRNWSMSITWPPSFASCGKAWKTPLSVPRHICKRRCSCMSLAWTEKRRKKYLKSSRKLARQGGCHSITLSLHCTKICQLYCWPWVAYLRRMLCGLLKNIQGSKFIATLYVLNSILPHLAYLSLAFQKGKVNFGHIKPTLKDLKTGQMLQTMRTHLTPEGITKNKGTFINFFNSFSI